MDIHETIMLSKGKGNIIFSKNYVTKQLKPYLKVNKAEVNLFFTDFFHFVFEDNTERIVKLF